MSKKVQTEEWYKLAFDAWDEGTHDLTLEEEAALLRVCNQIYRRRGPIPNSKKLLCSLWRCHPNRADRLLEALVVAGKIIITPDGHLTNNRANTELVTRQEVSDRRASSGRLGGRPKSDPDKKTNENNDPKKQLVNTGKAEEKREDKNSSPKGEGAEAPMLLSERELALLDLQQQKSELFSVGEKVLKSRSMVGKLLKSQGENIPKSRAIIEQARTMGDPISWINRIITNKRTTMAGAEGADKEWRTM